MEEPQWRLTGSASHSSLEMDAATENSGSRRGGCDQIVNLLAAQRLFANETTIQCRLLKIHIYKTLDIQTTGVNYKYAAGGAKPEVLHRIFIDDAD